MAVLADEGVGRANQHQKGMVFFLDIFSMK
jgi:hypothetical protein